MITFGALINMRARQQDSVFRLSQGFLRHGFLAVGLMLPLLLGLACTTPGKPQPARCVSVTEFGAVGDGIRLNTTHFQSAIDSLAAGGGGTLTVPKGVFVSGALFLKPRVNLHLDEGAVIKGSTDLNDYPRTRTRIEGHFEDWVPALINADHADHLRIDGPGTLDGSGAPFWKEFFARFNADRNTRNLDVPRPRLMFVQNSADVQIRGIAFKNSAFWNLHLYRCHQVFVEQCRFEVPPDAKAPSSDGTDIDSSHDVTIRGCYYRVNDDCICLKGSKGPFALHDQDSPPVSRIRVSDCTFDRGDGMLTLGSEATAVRDVEVQNCRVGGVSNLLRLKLRPDTPQLYEDIHCHHLTVDGTGAILQIQPWRQYFDLQGQPPPKSIVRDVKVSDVQGKGGAFGVIVPAPGQTDISDITLRNIDLQLKNEKLKAVEVKNLRLEQVTVNGKPVALESIN